MLYTLLRGVLSGRVWCERELGPHLHKERGPSSPAEQVGQLESPGLPQMLPKTNIIGIFTAGLLWIINTFMRDVIGRHNDETSRHAHLTTMNWVKTKKNNTTGRSSNRFYPFWKVKDFPSVGRSFFPTDDQVLECECWISYCSLSTKTVFMAPNRGPSVLHACKQFQQS